MNQHSSLAADKTETTVPVLPADAVELGGGRGSPIAPQPMTLAALDTFVHGIEGRFIGGASPLALGMATADWALHLLNAPFSRAELALDAVLAGPRLLGGLFGAQAVEPETGDHRFADPAWKNQPYSLFQQAFLLAEDWAANATSDLPGVSAEHQRLVSFATRQWLDIFSPSNFPFTNPEIVARTFAERGGNLVTGLRHMADDLVGRADKEGEAPGTLKVGRDLAVTPGKVVFRDALIELIQYAPSTATVRPEPVLIVPAWIMKYYILDLSPHNSLVRYLVDQGYSVFCISWRNPDAALRDTGFDQYRRSVMAALDAVTDISGAEKVHAAGYCLGGTLLSVAASAMARDGNDRLASLTLFAAQTDFTEAGELQLFIDEDQLAFLDDVMATQGYLDGRQMGGAFQLLRSRDLIWSKLVRSYWLGEQDHPNDLMTWNDDATRMPARMHSEYLRRFFLRNDFAEGRFEVEGRPVALSDVHLPFFVVGTETDHVAPWHSVHKVHLLNAGEVTFVLTSGGHNAGIVSEPGHPHRHFRIATRAAGAPYAGPDGWAETAERREGSWWPAWSAWLAERSGAQDRHPPSLGWAAHAPLADAPGSYVMER